MRNFLITFYIAASSQFTWVNEHFERIKKQRLAFLFSMLSVLLNFLLIRTIPAVATDATDPEIHTQQHTQQHTAQQTAGTLSKAIDFITETYGTQGVVIAFDFDDTLFAKEVELSNGQRLRYTQDVSNC